jgi:signal recognition particle subunit SEC65
MKKTEDKKRFSGKLAVIVICSGMAVIYFGITAYFHNRFLPSTMLNGINVSGKSAEQVETMLKEEIDGYVLKLEERNGRKEEIRGEDISLKPEFGDSISSLVDNQNAFSWPVSFFMPRNLSETTMVEFEEEKLEEAAAKLECMQKENQENPKNAYCSEYSANGYEIISEEQGSKIKKKALMTALKEGIAGLKETISLEEENCYAKPKITSDHEGLIQLVDTLNQYTGVVLTYDEGEKTQTLDGSITHNWMDITDMQVSINEEKVAEYVDELASVHNTVFRKHTLKTSYGETIDIVNGDYGWKVDKAGEKEQIIQDIKEGISKKREITYERRGASRGENDYGDTYVEINLTAQHLFFYKNGSLVTESDFVSGNISKNYDTPTGIYGLTYKQKDAVLRGENYASPVDFWMPFCNNVGMHDASWRSSFGGGIYKTSGSHGCINLPRSAAQKIFENIEEGDPVIVYTLPGTESAAVAAQEAAQVTALIQSIGEVTLESEPAIVMARKMYNLLSPKGQAQVPNYDVLAASEAQLAALKAQAAAEAAAQQEPPQ